MSGKTYFYKVTYANNVEIGDKKMGLFDLFREIGASIELALATPADDETMAQVYDYMSMSNDDQELLRVCKFDLGYGLDAHVAIKHIGTILKLKEKGMNNKDIGDVCGISEEMVDRAIKMRDEYLEYEKTGKLPENTNHQEITKKLDKAEALKKFNEASALRAFMHHYSDDEEDECEEYGEDNCNDGSPESDQSNAPVTTKSNRGGSRKKKGSSTSAPEDLMKGSEGVKPFSTMVEKSGVGATGK